MKTIYFDHNVFNNIQREINAGNKNNYNKLLKKVEIKEICILYSSTHIYETAKRSISEQIDQLLSIIHELTKDQFIDTDCTIKTEDIFIAFKAFKYIEGDKLLTQMHDGRKMLNEKLSSPSILPNSFNSLVMNNLKSRQVFEHINEYISRTNFSEIDFKNHISEATKYEDELINLIMNPIQSLKKIPGISIDENIFRKILKNVFTESMPEILERFKELQKKGNQITIDDIVNTINIANRKDTPIGAINAILQMYNCWPDKKKTIIKKDDKIDSFDSQHLMYGMFCNYFITSERHLYERALLIKEKEALPLQVLLYKDFIILDSL